MGREPARRPVPNAVRDQVLAEAGYRCGVPRCNRTLALDMHHIVEVAEGGGNEPGNLIALCGYCHDMFHRGHINREAMRIWKGMLVTLSRAFDRKSIDDLLFLALPAAANLRVSGDGVLHFSSLTASGLATFEIAARNGPLILYSVTLTPAGAALVAAWQAGDPAALQRAQVIPSWQA